MKNKSLLIKLNLVLLLLFSLLNNSCRKSLKNLNDYLPKINISSTEIQEDGSLLITGTIESKGYSDVEYAGFCYNTSPKPNILDNQIIAEINGNTFTAIYKSGFDENLTYYFRPWAGNAEGYDYGADISLSNIIAPTVTPSCVLANNILEDGGSSGTRYYYSVDAPYLSQYWMFVARPQSGGNLSFVFGSAITTGIYTIENNNNPAPGNVNVTINVGSWKALESGSKVYVNKIAKDTFNISICDAPWKFSATTTLTLSTRFKCPS